MGDTIRDLEYLRRYGINININDKTIKFMSAYSYGGIDRYHDEIDVIDKINIKCKKVREVRDFNYYEEEHECHIVNYPAKILLEYDGYYVELRPPGGEFGGKALIYCIFNEDNVKCILFDKRDPHYHTLISS